MKRFASLLLFILGITLSQPLFCASFPVCNRGEVCTEPVSGMDFIWIPPGCFRMGCDTRGGVAHACEEDEKPVRQVCLDGFWLARTELTRGQLARLRGEPATPKADADLPAVDISWYDTKILLSELRALLGPGLRPRLPTESEWEYACTGGGKTGPYAGGELPEGAGWEAANAEGQAHAVAQRPPNPLGLYDMSGNVWEWCEDSYFFTAYSFLGQHGPKNTQETYRRIRRGGSFRYCTTCARCANRKSAPPEDRMDDIGVRFALEPAPAQ